MNENIRSSSVPNMNPDSPKHGQGLRKLVELREQQLRLALTQLPKDSGPGERADIETALGALKALLTGNLDQIPEVVADELSQWIETSKYLGAKQMRRTDEALRQNAAAAAEDAAARKREDEAARKREPEEELH